MLSYEIQPKIPPAMRIPSRWEGELNEAGPRRPRSRAEEADDFGRTAGRSRRRVLDEFGPEHCWRGGRVSIGSREDATGSSAPSTNGRVFLRTQKHDPRRTRGGNER